MGLDYHPAILLACAMGLALVTAGPARAADRSHQIVFKKTIPDGKIWPDIRETYYDDDELQVIANVNDTTVSRIERMIREKLTWTARFDLDEDGKDELFVVIGQSYSCGTAGCSGIVLEHDANGWRRLSSLGIVPRPFILKLRDSERADFYRKSDPRWAKLIEKYGPPQQSTN